MSEPLLSFAVNLDGEAVIVPAWVARALWIRSNSVGCILDVACGEGYVYSLDFLVWGPNKKVVFRRVENVTSLDVRNVVKIYAKKNIPNLRFIQGDAEALPFKDDSFDTVTLSEILEHPVDPSKVLCEAKRVGRTRIIVTVPDEVSWIKRRVYRHFSIIDSCEHVRFFDSAKLERFFRQAGLTAFEIQHVLFGALEFYTATVDLELA